MGSQMPRAAKGACPTPPPRNMAVGWRFFALADTVSLGGRVCNCDLEYGLLGSLSTGAGDHMLTFQCPKCRQWLGVSHASPGENIACPHCGTETAIGPNPAPPPLPGIGYGRFGQAGVSELRKPAMPGVIVAGLSLYFLSFLLSVVSSLVGQAGENQFLANSPDQAAALAILV